MNEKDAFQLLESHPDAAACEAAKVIKNVQDRRIRILTLVQEALTQIRLDMAYLRFDLEVTRRERDEALAQ